MQLILRLRPITTTGRGGGRGMGPPLRLGFGVPTRRSCARWTLPLSMTMSVTVPAVAAAAAAAAKPNDSRDGQPQEAAYGPAAAVHPRPSERPARWHSYSQRQRQHARQSQRQHARQHRQREQR
mmetsp:Transcript_30939/g.90469  ORF Transcript_30939/g.90469 Transcript_30939/m.90469 type:complete len:124 (+) Transcript_30939:1301-1672(+)